MNAAQFEYWNTAVGRTWAELQTDLDRQIAPLGREALRALGARAGERVIDIGCGCGETSLDLAERVGPGGRVVGVDISLPMLQVARHRPLAATMTQPEFRQWDAESADLGRAEFDAAFSRFGVMFFADAVAAFANIRRCLTPAGRMAFVCWRALRENAWMREPLEAAAPFFPPSAPAEPGTPGPFAFADADRLRGVLDAAGFTAVSIDPFDALVGGGNPDQAFNLAFRVGPLASAAREHPHLKDAAGAAVRAVILRHATPRGVLMPAAVWVVRASV